MTLTYKQQLVRALNYRCFKSIWNETSAEYRTNVKLSPVAGRALKSSVTVGTDYIGLPTNDAQYLCFTAPIQAFMGGLIIQSGEWVNGEDLLAGTDVFAYLYTASGKLMPRKQIYIYRTVGRSGRVFIAVPKHAVSKVFGLPTGAVYLTLYRDSDQVNDITCKSWYADPFDLVASTTGLLTYFSEAKIANAHGTIVYVNGVELDETAATIPYVAGDFIEIVCDRNVVGSFDVNVSNNTTGYYSTLTSKYREIIHCPKALNPDNKLITHNTCMLTVRDSSKKGRYLHRADQPSVGQITHNDLSVETDVVDAYRDHLDTENVHIHVRVRTHSKENVLMRELTYVSYLYTCDDAEIIQHLRGELEAALSFWKASELEQSTYVQFMFDSPNGLSESLLDTYINGIGYYAVAAILAANVYHTTLDGTVRTISVNKPTALIGRGCRPQLYLRGVKINGDMFTFSDTSTQVYITLSASLYLEGDDPVSIVLIENGTASPYVFQPVAESTAFTVPFEDVVVFEEIALAATAVGRSTSSDYSYKKVEALAGTLLKTQNSDGTTTITAGASLFGKTLIVCNKHFSSVSVIDIQNAVTVDKGAIVAPATLLCANDETKTVPMLAHTSCEVYVNGYRLIEGIDYSAVPLTDDDDNVALLEVILSCADRIGYTAGANWMEVIYHTGTTIASDVGFCFEEKVSYDAFISNWHDRLGRCYVNGHLAQDVVDAGTWIETEKTATTGYPYEIVVCLPGIIGDVLSDYTPTADLNRIQAIRSYFGRTVTVDKSVVDLTDGSYNTFSPYLAQIIRDIIEGDFVAVNDPDDDHFVAQFAAYDYLKDRDPTITDPNGILDRVYADAFMTYVTDWIVAGPSTLEIINRLAALILPNDSNTMGSN